jgi:hypothetical protein
MAAYRSIPTIYILQFRQIINDRRQFNISGGGNDAELLDPVKATTPFTSAIEADDFFVFGWF